MSNQEPFWKSKKFYCACALGLSFLVGIPWWFAYKSGIDQPKITLFWTGVQAIGTFLTAIAIVAAFGQVREARKQLRDNRSWNKMSFALTYLPAFDSFYAWEKELEETFVQLISRNIPLTQEEVSRVFHDDHKRTHLLLKSYLNALEGYCVAINSGLADGDIAKRLMGYKLVRHFIELRPYIDHLRNRNHDDGLYCEIEKVYQNWHKLIEAPTPAYGED